MNQENKRAAIFRIEVFEASKLIMSDVVGQPTVKIRDNGPTFTPASAEFRERCTPGHPVEQDFFAILTDTTLDNIPTPVVDIRQPLVIVLYYTNGERRVVGSKEFPVLLDIEEQGRPAVLRLSFKRQSPEKAKLLQSF